MEENNFQNFTQPKQDPLKNLFGEDYEDFKAVDSDDGKSWDSFEPEPTHGSSTVKNENIFDIDESEQYPKVSQ